MVDEACEVRPAGNRERAFTRIDPNCNLLTQNILIILHDVIVVNNNLSILIRNDISYWLISTYHQNCEDRLLVKSPWYQRLYTFSSPPNCIFFFTMAQLMRWEELTTGRGRAIANTAGNAKINEGNLLKHIFTLTLLLYRAYRATRHIRSQWNKPNYLASMYIPPQDMHIPH